MMVTDEIITKATTDAQSEKDLARSLGYPSSWHVIRVVPHPAELDGVDNVSEPRNIGSFNDTIYAGDPAKGVDVYYNHSAALGAAMEWKEGESTGYDNRGGQLLPRVPQFQKDAWVEVYYPEEDTWYKAQVQKVKQYVDDIRYSVYYVQEDATQVVPEDLLRAYNPPPSKKRKRVPSTPKSKKTNQTKPSSTQESNDQDERINAQKIKRQEQFKKYLATLSQEQILSRKKMAKDIGLPDNWLAYRNSNYIFDIRNPLGDRFTSKKAALDSLRNLVHDYEDELQKKEVDKEVQKTSKRAKKSNHNKNAEVKDHDEEEEEKGCTDDDVDASTLDIEDEGDPPFRKTGHNYLGKKVKYKYCPDGQDGVEIVQCGIVKGWLDSTDVDSSGNPAFISELTGHPGVLFHVVFKVEKELNKKYGADLLLDYVDIEQWELEEFMNADD